MKSSDAKFLSARSKNTFQPNYLWQHNKGELIPFSEIKDGQGSHLNVIGNNSYLASL